MLVLTNLIQKFEEKFPLSLAESWDNVGLLIGDEKKEIKKVLVCLDITNNAVNKAIEEGVDLIISHHPLLFSPLKRILSSHLIGNKVLKLMKNDISVYASHTNLDSGLNGLNDYVLKKMNLPGKKIEEDSSVLRPLRFFELEEELSIEQIASMVKENLHLRDVRLVKGDIEKKIKKIALVTGAGSSFIPELIDKVDLLITGDLKHHDSLDTVEQGMYLMDIGHDGSEKHCVDLLEDILKKIDEKIEVIKHREKDLFITV